MTEAEMVGWHHQLNGHGFGQTPGLGGGQGGLVCCDSWGAKSRTQLRDLTELYFHTNCEIFCSSSVKNTIDILIGVALDL